MEWMAELVTSIRGVSPVGAALWVVTMAGLGVAYKALAVAACAIRGRDKRDE